MTKFQDLDIPKEYKKKKKILFYKAFVLKDGDEMTLQTDVDILSLSHDAALLHMITSLKIEDATALNGKTVSFLILEIRQEELALKNVIDQGEVYCQDLNVSISLNDKIYKINVEDRIIEDIEIEIDPKNEIKTIKHLTLVNPTTNEKLTVV